jgi:hypothetical protein
VIDTLEITTVASCSVRCTICPQDALKAAYPKADPHRLTLSDFCFALMGVPQHVRIDFSGFVEPWLNPDCTEMLAYALSAGYRVAVYTTCVGMKDAADVARILISARDKVDVVCVHLADGERMRTIVAESDVRAAFVSTLQDSRINLEVMSMKDSPQFTPIDRAGLVQLGKAPLRHKGPIRCSYSDTYTHNVMLPNGDVHL